MLSQMLYMSVLYCSVV